MLSGSQSQKAVYCVIPFPWNYREDKNQVTKQISGRRGTGGGEGDVSAKGPVGAFSGDGILLPLSCGGGYTIITKTH